MTLTKLRLQNNNVKILKIWANIIPSTTNRKYLHQNLHIILKIGCFGMMYLYPRLTNCKVKTPNAIDFLKDPHFIHCVIYVK